MPLMERCPRRCPVVRVRVSIRGKVRVRVSDASHGALPQAVPSRGSPHRAPIAHDASALQSIATMATCPTHRAFPVSMHHMASTPFHRSAPVSRFGPHASHGVVPRSSVMQRASTFYSAFFLLCLATQP